MEVTEGTREAEYVASKTVDGQNQVRSVTGRNAVAILAQGSAQLLCPALVRSSFRPPYQSRQQRPQIQPGHNDELDEKLLQKGN